MADSHHNQALILVDFQNDYFPGGRNPVVGAEATATVAQNHPNAFRETTLLAELQSRQISRLLICGMMTHMCIDTTVRSFAKVI